MSVSHADLNFDREISRELIAEDSEFAAFISINPARMHGEPCFAGSRVPVQHLFDHLRAGEPLEDFLEGFGPVTKVQAVGVLDLAARGLLNQLRQL